MKLGIKICTVIQFYGQFDVYTACTDDSVAAVFVKHMHGKKLNTHLMLLGSAEKAGSGSPERVLVTSRASYLQKLVKLQTANKTIPSTLQVSGIPPS